MRAVVINESMYGNAHVVAEHVAVVLHTVPDVEAGMRAAAFDPRLSGPPMLTGRASRGIAYRLASHERRLAIAPESRLVDRVNQLVEGATEPATHWGAQVGQPALTASWATARAR